MITGHAVTGIEHGINMTVFEVRKVSRQVIAQGLLAGLLGGIAGSGAKLIGEWIYPPRTEGQQAPPAVLAEKIAGHPLSESNKTLATQAFHWTTGSFVGAIYGGVAEVLPAVTSGYGTAFGIVVLLLTHETTLPLMGLDKPPTQQPIHEQTSEIATHALYGFATELVRRWWRNRSHGLSTLAP